MGHASSDFEQSLRDELSRFLSDHSESVSVTGRAACEPFEARGFRSANESLALDDSRAEGRGSPASFKSGQRLLPAERSLKGRRRRCTPRTLLLLTVLAVTCIALAVAVPLGVKAASRSQSGSATNPVAASPSNTIKAPPSSSAAPSPSPSHHIKPKGSNASDPFDIGNSLFDGSCGYYLNTVKSHLNASIPSGNINNNGVTSFRQYDCTINDFTRCPAGSGTWAGDATWVWNKVMESTTDPYRYNVIWFMQLIGDSDDLFHECDETPRAFDVSEFATTPLNLKPNCMTLGKWCRTWAGHVAQDKTINVQGTDYSVEDAFLKLSNNRIKIDFKDETIYMSYLRSTMSLDDQVAIALQFSEDGTGNCITDQHFCYECNNYPGHCTAGEGCLRYKDNDGGFYCP
ncbi:hypothetical protein BC830DRAFT_1155048 [Chytriomyces sp. MP71]|nr:hypothetical protein BC830DRAFT_1155048 [Chytriomyces sp. MP71]